MKQENWNKTDLSIRNQKIIAKSIDNTLHYAICFATPWAEQTVQENRHKVRKNKGN